ncbi:MAG: nucleotidyl transferase AbiEii/AbiGii toxin family protein [Candidatus Micrarchaeota archaeon]|nr:nucleotidyl transferase AbiEii/AbiGii toxin family protein [Planctomycetota bacterium]MDE1849726.1 nucleotidyl transferase AbiEii/AbiGii toxin family protein [Candidatus Micrarchaeota archaeon]
MPYDVNIDQFALRTGINADRLRRNLETYQALAELFPLLEASRCKVGMFGGTAINKIYFGKAQRLSYDIDIFAYDYQRTIKILKENGAFAKYSAAVTWSRKVTATKMSFKDVILDVVDAKNIAEQPAKMQAFDLLYYMGQLVPPVVVPSYSLEYLLAHKTLAMLDRHEMKDIYDMWFGIRLMKEKVAYYRELRKLAKQRKTEDLAVYTDFQLRIMISNIEYYKYKRIEVVSQPDTGIMLREIKAFMDRLLVS